MNICLSSNNRAQYFSSFSDSFLNSLLTDLFYWSFCNDQITCKLSNFSESKIYSNIIPQSIFTLFSHLKLEVTNKIYCTQN